MGGTQREIERYKKIKKRYGEILDERYREIRVGDP
jgi:hypothetical protein